MSRDGTQSADVLAGLTRLGDVFDSWTAEFDRGGKPYSGLFGEFIFVDEWGLAVEVVCDFLVAEHPEFITTARLALIEELHDAMEVEDDCMSRLKAAMIVARSQSSAKSS